MRRYKPLLTFLDRMGYGAMVLGADNRILLSNATATSLVRELAKGDHEKGTDVSRLCIALRRPCELASVAETWIAVSRTDVGKRPVLVHVALANDQGASGPAKIAVMVDLETKSSVNPAVLRRLFDLTPAESRVAIAIASGRSPDEIACALRRSAATVRKQLAAVFAKTSTRRQSELNMLVNRLSILP